LNIINENRCNMATMIDIGKMPSMRL
jgi:hypothetical protein